jgi:hypothetical protein
MRVRHQIAQLDLQLAPPPDIVADDYVVHVLGFGCDDDLVGGVLTGVAVAIAPPSMRDTLTHAEDRATARDAAGSDCPIWLLHARCTERG